MDRTTVYTPSDETPRDIAPGGVYQRALALVFLFCAALMCSQYTFYKYGPAKVIVSPWGRDGEETIAYYSKPKDGVDPSEIQKPGTYLLNWATFDKVAYKLHSTKSVPPAELLGALLFMVALPLALVYGRRMPWPRWPQWFFVLVACAALLGANEFKEGVKELAQWVLVMMATWWLAGVAVGDGRQARRLGRWLLALTGLLLLLAVREYFAYTVLTRPAQPLLVRASLQSRSAYGGLMAVFLTMAFARGLASRDARLRWGLVAMTAVGSFTMMSLGALLALYVGCLAVAARRSRRFAWDTVAGIVLMSLVNFGIHGQILRESVSFLHYSQGRPVGVEKRYLEMAAALNMFNGSQDETLTRPDPKAKPGEEAQLLPVGSRNAATFGVGPGLNYQEVVGKYYGTLDNPKKQEPDTYNLYLLLACQLGIFGALAWAWILFDGAALAAGAADRLRDPELRALAEGLRGGFLAVLVFSVWGTLLVRGTGMMLFTLLALAWRLSQIAEIEPSADAPPPAEAPLPTQWPQPAEPEVTEVLPPVVDEPASEPVESAMEAPESWPEAEPEDDSDEQRT